METHVSADIKMKSKQYRKIKPMAVVFIQGILKDT